MKDYTKYTIEQLKAEKELLQKAFEDYISRKIKLDMSRGKPGADQLDLCGEMLTYGPEKLSFTTDGTDTRNYGGVDGLDEMKKIFADILEISQNEVIVGGNASLSMMFDMFSHAMTKGVSENDTPWIKLPKVKFLCPSPGYDRHFSICEYFGIEMITVPMTDTGPDMDEVEKLVIDDEYIKGIWCVPKYSNPEGITYSDDTVERLAKMKTAAEHFRIFWDNAYVVHDLFDESDVLKNIMNECKKAGNPDRVYMFTSTSKITFPGAGICAMGTSSANINFIKKRLTMQTIGPDKINQLRHIVFLKDLDNIKEHMKKHAKILKPKFDTVLKYFETELGSRNIAGWKIPHGGYFISLNVIEGLAREIVGLAGKAGVKLTPAGATYPYGKDPKDSNIRIAPTFPAISELEKAMEVLCVCIRLASVEYLMK